MLPRNNHSLVPAHTYTPMLGSHRSPTGCYAQGTGVESAADAATAATEYKHMDINEF